MANELTVLDTIKLPAYLQNYRIDTEDDEYDVPGGEPIARLGIKGKVFSVHYMGTKTQITAGDSTGTERPVQYLDIMIVAGKEGFSRTYYPQYEEGSMDPPDCAALDGMHPERDVPDRQVGQNETCANCQWSAFGTGNDGKSQKCQQNKRIAFVPRGDVANETYGGPVLMTITPGSFKNFRPYKKRLAEKGLQLHMVYTRLSFDLDAAFPKLIFDFAGVASQEDLAAGAAWRAHEHTERVLYVNSNPNSEQAELPVENDRQAEEAPRTSQPVVVAPRAPETPSRPTVAADPPKRTKPGAPRREAAQAPPPAEVNVSTAADPDATLRALIDGGGLRSVLDGDITIPN